MGAAVVLTLLFSEERPTTATHVGEAILVVVGALSTIAAIGLFFLAFQEVPRLRIVEPVVQARLIPHHDVANTPSERTSGTTVSSPSFVAASSGPDGTHQAFDVAQLQSAMCQSEAPHAPKACTSASTSTTAQPAHPSSRSGPDGQTLSPAALTSQIRALRRRTFQETASVSGSMSLPNFTTTSNAMRSITTLTPQGGKPCRLDLIPWSMSLLAVQTPRPIRPGTT